MQAQLEVRSELIAQCLSLEMGAAIGYARTAQVPLAIAHVKTARDVLTTFPFVEQRSRTAVTREPIGVCALITPWNWPLYQITAKVAPALAAGCTVVLKPSELSALDALLFAEAIEEAGFPAGVFSLVQGDGPGVGASLASHPDVDMISITGSTRAGIAVAQAAAPTVKRVAQELGGKSPNVILPDADLNRAVSLGIAAAFRNLGQSCSAPTRMIVPGALLSEIESIAKRAADEMVVGDPLSESTTHGAIANRAQFDRIQSMIGVGISEGAKLVTGGQGRPRGLNAGLYVKPTVFPRCAPACASAQEEIFWPGSLHHPL
ncbi:aldehyde dehydrogenase family protein (plasmid) [Mesorhizobium atlanticum]|uniref:aldehyde dehydrogenase family protein n=1 Tax=Mesorhizobium atlanticum TaxID=2233532 RepID=UPI003703F041